MKRIVFFALMLISVIAFGQNKVFDTITFYRGGNIYKLLLYNDSLQINNKKYYSFPGWDSMPETGDQFWSQVPGATNNIYAVNTGYVGIGTSDPQNKLQVSGTIYANSNGGVPIIGISSTNYGVSGTSTSSYGGSFVSSTGVGLLGSSTSGNGINAISSSGIGGNFTSSTNFSVKSMGKTWLDSLLYVRYLPWGTGSERMVVWDTVTKQFKKYSIPSQLVPADNILDWTGTAYAPYSSNSAGKLYTGSTDPVNWTRLNYDGMFYAKSFNVTGGSYHAKGICQIIGESGIAANYPSFSLIVGSTDTCRINAYTQGSTHGGWNYQVVPIYIGGYRNTGIYSNNEYLKIDDEAQRFTINFTKVKLAKGTANKYLMTDANNEISYVSNPSSWTISGNDIYNNNIGNVGIGDSSPTAKLDINSDIIRIRTAKTPASATAAGNAGDVCWDADYIYICTATNTWKRSPITTW